MKTVDPFKFADLPTRKLMEAFIAREPRPSEIPWTPLRKPLRECRVALISTAGIARDDDVPFDQQGERDDPFWGDPSFRVLPRGTTENDVRLYHLHIATRFGEQDLDCVLPLRRLEELQKAGVIGEVAPRHFSLMGYILDPTELVGTTAPRLAQLLKADGVDAVVLVPA